jgi:hypothetical protein
LVRFSFFSVIAFSLFIACSFLIASDARSIQCRLR